MTLPSIQTGVVHTVPKDLKETLIKDKKTLEIWNTLTPLARNEWICYIISTKKQETRENHIVQLQESLQKGKRRPCCWAGCSHR